MSLRTALRQTWLLTFAVLAVAVWVGFTAWNVFGTVGSVVGDTTPTLDALGNTVGPAFASGVVGLGVMLALLGLMVVMFGELEEGSPAPDEWPPEEYELRERERS